MRKVSLWLLILLVATGLVPGNMRGINPRATFAAEDDMKKEEPVSWDFKKIENDPLEVEVVQDATEGNVRVEALYFTSEVKNGFPYRIFGYYAYPTNVSEKLPAVVLLHGGGGTADRGGAVWRAQQGYACLSIDWTGKTPGRQHYSDFGKADRGINTLKTDWNDDFIHAAAVAVMRSVTFLASRDEVDPKKIGLEGGSWGSYLSMLVNGLDKRIKTIVASYGCGGFEFEDSNCSRGVNYAALAKRQRWYNYYDPLAYAGKMYGSVIMFTPTNDSFFWLNSSVMNFKAIKGKKTQVIISNLDHQMDPTTGGCVMKWFERELKDVTDLEFPKTPKVSHYVKNNKLFVKIEPAVSDDITEVQAFVSYGPGGRWAGRYWYNVDTKKESRNWGAELPVLDISDTIYYCVTITASNATRSSWGIGEAVAKDAGITKPTARFNPVLDDFEEDIGSWLIGQYLFGDETLVSEYENDQRGRVLRIKMLGAENKAKNYAIRTHKFDGYLINKFGCKGLSFWVSHKMLSGNIKVTLYVNESQKNEKRKSFTVNKKEDADWEEVRVDFSNFENLNLEEVNALWITGKSDSSLSPSFDEFKVYK